MSADACIECCIFVIFVYLVAMMVYLSHSERKKKRIKQQDRDERFGRGEYLFQGVFPILAGLRLVQGTDCTVYCLRKRIVIEASGQQFTLARDKLIDVSVMSKTEIQEQYVPDVGGAVAGAMALGPLGALLGGGADRKTIRHTSYFLVITYNTADGKIDYLVFDATGRSSCCKRFRKEFKYLKQRKKISVEL